MSGHFTPGELTSFKRGGWRGLAQGAKPMGPIKKGRPSLPTLLVAGEAIQWHRGNSSHDQCPRCGATVGYLGPKSRCCIGACEGGGLVFTLPVTPDAWLHGLGFNEAERAALLKKQPGRQGKRQPLFVQPGFLYGEGR